MMISKNKLKNPPIIEALIQFNFSTPLPVTDEVLFSYSKKINWTSERINQLNVTTQNGTENVINNLFGLRLKNNDNTKVFVATKESFSLSYLNMSYNSWEPFCEEFKQQWTVYSALINADNISRIGVRFINRIPVSGSKNTLKRYFKPTIPFFPDEKEKSADDFLIRLIKKIDEIEGKGLITIASEHTIDNSNATFLYDIDLYSEKNHRVDSSDVWQKLNEIRAKKNIIFFNSFTEEGLEALDE